MTKKIAVVLSGCGHRDGSEITEAVSALIAITEAGAEYQCFAPDRMFTATNHIDGAAESERNILTEAARIARGKIEPVEKLNPSEFDALVFPGGYGAALQLSTWGKEGAKGTVLPAVERIIRAFHDQSKPIGAICIAPTLLAKTLGKQGVTLTIGNDKETAQEIEKTGARHEDCPVTDYITDRENKVLTTPAYMYDDAKPSEVFQGIRGLISELVEMA